ncbi:MAG: hypothetical protein LBR16_03910 [Treponema sp.]|jgi:tetratricopeptide (TPR) repeat protein|nr:hypothetical protein [Treponema sp.]
MDAEQKVKALVETAYDHLKDMDADKALAALEEALKVNVGHPEALYALKCFNWWRERLGRMNGIEDSYERGVFVISQWNPYYHFIDRIGEAYEPCQYAIKCFVYQTALESFGKVFSERTNQQDSGLLLQIGRCYKGAGAFYEAREFLKQAVRNHGDDAAAVAELADLYALLGEERAARALFREAFYIDPQAVNLRTLESELIRRLWERVCAEGYQGPEAAEWIPVYGKLWGVFSIKRELKPVEVGRLKESILALEQSVAMDSGQEAQAFTKPRLLNRYFWLIDCYAERGAQAGAIEEILLKMQILDPVICEQYRGGRSTAGEKTRRNDV